MVANNAQVSKKVTTNAEVRWKKPEVRLVKVNVDTSFFVDRRDGAVGAVIRDFQGGFIAASSKCIPHVSSATMVEAMAMKEGLALAHRRGYSSITAEGDYLETIEACSGVERWWTESSAIYADCVDLMTTMIGEVMFKFCPREANKVSHDLARDAYS
jgi:ribonuclease HI